jgi:hypothetical protein
MKKIFWIAVVMVMLLFGFIVVTGQKETLIALEPITIYKDIEGKIAIAQISPGTYLPVLRCIDTKSIIIPEVQLHNKEIGYVVFGNFRMEYTSIFNFTVKSPIVISFNPC